MSNTHTLLTQFSLTVIRIVHEVFPSALEAVSDLSTEELRERLQEVTEVRTGRRMTFDMWFAMVQLIITLN